MKSPSSSIRKVSIELRTCRFDLFPGRDYAQFIMYDYDGAIQDKYDMTMPDLIGVLERVIKDKANVTSR